MNIKRLLLLNAIAKTLKRFPEALLEVSDYESCFTLSIKLKEKTLE